MGLIICLFKQKNSQTPESSSTDSDDSNESKSTSRKSRFVSNLFACSCLKKDLDVSSTFSEAIDGADGLLPKPSVKDENKICLVIDLDETLVHSSFVPTKRADFVLHVQIENISQKIYVRKRPHAEFFINTVGPLFECILFTASRSQYADQVVDRLDKNGYIHFRLYREACILKDGHYLKDLSLIGRNLTRVIIVDDSPYSYMKHKQNALPVAPWTGDPKDVELLRILPLLVTLSRCRNVYQDIPRAIPDPAFNFKNVKNYIPPSVS